MSDVRSGLASVRAEIDAGLDEVIGRPASVSLLMFPFDGNVGNHMMWAAITDYLAARDIRVAYAAHAANLDLDAMRRAGGDGPVLFLGGVTMSRLWPVHLEAKRVVAAAFSDRRIVQLTSTALFVDDDDRAEAREVFGGHGGVTIIARDPHSGRQLADVFGDSVDIRVAHDSALRLEPAEPSTLGEGIGWLARGDAERLDGPSPGVGTFDWPEIHEPVHRATYVALRATGVLSRCRRSRVATGPIARAVNAPIAAGYGWASRRLVDYGVRVLQSHSVLVTDRMHPHLLALLIGLPVILLPDQFGKNRAVYDFTSHRFPNVHWADDAGEALALARRLERA